MTTADPNMVIVTTAAGDERSGCLVGFHAQSGMEPDTLSVWLSKANRTFRVAVLAEVLAVHFLTADDHDLAEAFGTVSGDATDKFAGRQWAPGPSGVPLLERCPNRIVGRKMALLDVGSDHVCVVLDPIAASYTGAFTPLRFSDVADLDAGHGAEERPIPATTRSS